MNMNTRLMIRLIDVALIILLGFIAISRLKTEFVDLSSSTSEVNMSQNFHEATLTVYRNSFKLNDRGNSWTGRSIQDLEHVLISKNNLYARQKTKLVVTIEPHKSCIMQKLVDVFDVCHRNKIEKSLSYESYN